MADADFNVKAIISAQTSQFEKGIKNAQSSINTMSKSIEGVQKLLKTAFSVVGIGVSIKAVTDFGRSCVQSATQAQKAFNILDNTVKATGADAWTSTKELKEASKSLSASTNYSVTEIQKMQSVLLGFTNITGEAFNEASDAVLDMATVMGMDLTSAVQTIGKALDDPITGLDSLRRQGFKFTDEQKGELAQLVKNGKQLEAQKIILDTLATSYGGAAKAGQDSFAKQRYAVENFKDTLGGKLIPVMQVFAENSAKTLNNLTNLISNMDFTPIVNVVTNLSKIFSSTFEKISNYLRSVKDEVTDFISRFNFKPIISILDTLAGVFITAFDRIKSRFNESSEMMNQLKESLINFSNSESFEKIVKVVNGIIDAIVFLWGEVERVAGEIRTFVVGKIIEVWNKIKELFNNSQEALANSESDIKSWGDYFYSIFNNIFRIAQDLINSVSALLNGDWQVAWEYAKLAVLRVAESVATTLESIKNGFKDKMQKMLSIASLAVKFLPGGMGIALSTALKGLESLTNTSSEMRSVIQEQIEETENKIQELTGHTADAAIKDLQGVSTQFAGFTSSALGVIEDLTDGVATETEKQKKYFKLVGKEAGASIQNFFEQFSDDLQANMKTIKDYIRVVNQSTAKMLHQLGYELAKGEVSWKSYAKIAVEGIAEVLKGLSAQLSALAVVKVASHDYATAAVLAAGATASMIASGALTAVAEGFDNVSTSAKEAGETVTKSAEEIKQALENIESTSSRTASNLFININKFSEQAENAQKSIDAMKSEFTDLQNKSTNAYLKYQDAFKEYLNKLKNMTRQGAEYYYQQIVKPLKDASDKISKEFKKVADEYSGYQDDLRNAKKAMREEGIKIVENLKAESDAVRETVTTYKTLYKAQTDYITARKKWDRLTTKQKATSQAEYLLGKNGTLYEEVKTLSTYVDIIFEEQLSNVSKTVSDIYSQLTNAGKKVGETLASSVISGASKTDFLKSMRDYIRENLIKLAVYTESFQDKLADIGGSLANALVSGTTSELRTVKKELENLYDEATKNAKKAENVISSVFGDIGEDIQSTISNFGGNIATTLVDSLANGLNQSDFLDNVKKWIRKMLIQSVVYTKTMKAELEAIGEAISRGISEGFTETSFHEIRRDLSWVFDQANKTISNIDDILNSVFSSGYATGTNNATSGLHLVGEAGPELVRFRGGEKVLNASNTNKALAGMGGNTNNFNVTFNNLQDTSAFAMMNQLKAYNRQMAINGVI